MSNWKLAQLFSCLMFVAALSSLAGASQPGSIKSVRYPWVYPGDFNERIGGADVVVSGSILSTITGKVQMIEGIDVMANAAKIKVDRIFKGDAKSTIMRFLWFSPAPVSEGMIYSGPPLAHFKPGIRYLVFLRHKPNGYVVAMPIYAIEVRLGPAPPSAFSQVPPAKRKLEIAQELEAAALLVPQPAPGMTGEAPMYFPYVVDLIGGCAEPFLQHFAKSRSKELRTAAQSWLALLVKKGMQCQVAG